MGATRVSEHKIGPFDYDEAKECIIRFAVALTNLGLQKRFSLRPEPQSVGHGFYQIVLLDKYPDKPKPASLTTLQIKVAEQAGYAKPKTTQYYEAFGERKTLGKWADVADVARTTLKARIDAGMTMEEAITDIALARSARRAA